MPAAGCSGPLFALLHPLLEDDMSVAIGSMVRWIHHKQAYQGEVIGTEGDWLLVDTGARNPRRVLLSAVQVIDY